MLTYIILDENDNKIPAIMTWHSTYSYQALIFTTKSALKGYFFSLLKEELQPLDKHIKYISLMALLLSICEKGLFSIYIL